MAFCEAYGPLFSAAVPLIQPHMERDLSFPNDLGNESLSENAMLALLKLMGFSHITV